MKIKCLGHSCFLITSDSGTRIITDPFDSQVGYAIPAIEADIVTTSHNHFDHGYTREIRGEFILLDKPGKYEQRGISITGISTYHDKENGQKRGSNIVFVINADGIRVCHCGDIGHIPGRQQISEIGGIDVLMVPVGGIYTVDAREAYEIVRLLKPKVTIPMHFKTPELKFELGELDEFLREAGVSGNDKVFAHKQEIEIMPSTLNSLPEILVLNYK